MIDDALVLRVERLRDEAESLKSDLRQRLRSASSQVVAADLRKTAAGLAERWLVEVAARPDIAAAIGAGELAERNVNFQRILTYAERATKRQKYDQALSAILKTFRATIIVPLKANRSERYQQEPVSQGQHVTLRTAKTVFVGKSFLDDDIRVNDSIERLLRALGLAVTTGEKPRAESVSRKVKDRIDTCDVFVGTFTRRDKLEGKNEWATSSWIVDEKAYALARQRKLVLIRESGVNSIGGLQGDYEYLEFDRKRLEDLMVRLVEIFRSEE